MFVYICYHILIYIYGFILLIFTNYYLLLFDMLYYEILKYNIIISTLKFFNNSLTKYIWCF